MAALPDDAREVVLRVRLGFVATVNADGSPNVSPKGTVTVWDDRHLAFADIRSPGTIANLRRDPRVEVNVVDPFTRKCFRFRGTARVLEDGPEYEALRRFYETDPRGIGGEAGRDIRAVVLIEVDETRPLVSPGYREGITESDMRRRWLAHYAGGDPAGGDG